VADGKPNLAAALLRIGSPADRLYRVRERLPRGSRQAAKPRLSDDSSLLHVVAAVGAEQVIRRGNIWDLRLGRTLLHLARMLIRRGAPVDRPNSDGLLPRDVAAPWLALLPNEAGLLSQPRLRKQFGCALCLQQRVELEDIVRHIRRHHKRTLKASGRVAPEEAVVDLRVPASTAQPASGALKP
jgi:hypothetical protein